MGSASLLCTRAADVLGLRKDLALFLAGTLLLGGAEELWMRFLPKYLDVLGAGVLLIGVFDFLRTVLGAVYVYPGGIAIDRWGTRGALQVFTLLSICGYLLLLLVPHAWAVLLGLVLVLAWSCLSLPASLGLIASHLEPRQYAMGNGVVSIIKRLPVLFAPLAGGWLIDRYGMVAGMRVALLITLPVGIVTLWLQNKIEDVPRLPEISGLRFREVVARFPQRLRRLLACDILVRLGDRLPAAWVVIYALDTVGASGAQVGALTSLEMAVSLLCYLPVAWLSDRWPRWPFVAATFGFFLLYPLGLLMTDGLAMLVVCAVLRGLREFGEPARKALILELSIPELRGRMVGAYFMIRDLTVAPAALVGAWLWSVSPALNFGAAALLSLAALLLFLFHFGRGSAGDRALEPQIRAA